MSTRLRLGLAVLAIGVAVLLWWNRPERTILPERAEALAMLLLDRYIRATADVPAHFLGPETVEFEDGWEFRWSYQPCAGIAELRVFIALSGRAAYSAVPDCAGGARPGLTTV